MKIMNMGLVLIKKWSTSYLKQVGYPYINLSANNQVFSNPIGFFAENKNFRLLRRLTHANNHFEQYNAGMPFLQKIDSLYKKLVPDCHCKQLERANKKPHLKIIDTSNSLQLLLIVILEQHFIQIKVISVKVLVI